MKLIDKAKTLMGVTGQDIPDVISTDNQVIIDTPQEKVEVPTPRMIISFENPAFPTFQFENWRPGISMGTIERAGQLMIREALREFAKMQQKLRVDEANAKTKSAEGVLTT